MSRMYGRSVRSLLLPRSGRAFRGVTHGQFGSTWLDQLRPPGGPGTFFKGHLQAAAESFEKIENGESLGFDRAFHHQLARAI
jgi:hypothetical protein